MYIKPQQGFDHLFVYTQVKILKSNIFMISPFN